ncbi:MULTISPECIES: epoxide hydrolase family protein [unclassified Streptomyces]|uniref:epoxide hydrolase family protein n=1 Tax=unclassified Streptomyces TaxID=2593676 RepID=UPI000DC7BB73|nr:MULTISPECIES: epoxide hydrolase family protein [unclassified Streptomyces]AWZ09070.1 epoxide hydrolase [Streptomyces sp. ICC4]AWZ15933.1 epoxide hydrolase [Streptomyces sp. ICC1]
MKNSSGTPTDARIRPFRIDVPQAELDDLRDRLARTRWATGSPAAGWSRGVPTDYLKALAAYWADGFDWRAAEAEFNEFPQFTTEIDGQNIHFLHVRSDNPDALPLLLMHDWPCSFVQFVDVIKPLAEDFHVIVTSTPGTGFSGPLSGEGWNTGRIAGAFVELMERLGYGAYGVQGTGGGAWIAAEMGRRAPDRVTGVHVNGLITFPSGDPAELDGLTSGEQERLARLEEFQQDKMGFAAIQSTRPQTLAHGLHDSPVGQLAWIAEKFKEWTDPAAELPEDAVGRDRLLANISVYWFTGTAGSSADLYYEAAHDPGAWAPKPRGTVPTGVAVALPTDIAIRRFAERDHHVTHWTELERGGNFLSLEQPEAFVSDVRTFFA